ncbi:DNA polymerase III subunit alpha [Alsobacter soli]|uniref:DNA polymerase III subunit alpha n=1 Tax=Alsobacter soli TaxID=2109933 RepID=A0A2T1HNG3_9HYPH|nr:DNA polymerase III subunit alpha [Alsobacter soli]PSC03172.1 DNA polymerase III subunit alpha [Alsobacter soli]
MSRILGDVGFVHLHVHSSFSLLEGALRIDELKKLALKDAMPALALTDSNNLFGALEFSEKISGAGIQPITGIELSVEFGDEKPSRNGLPPARPSLVLLAMTATGYANLMLLSSRAYMGPAPGEPPHVQIDELLRLSEGLICLTGGPDGPIDKALAAGQTDMATARLGALAGAFGDRVYVEIQRHGLDGESAVEGDLIALAYDKRLPIVGTNEPYFPKPDDYEAHDALLAIAEGRLVSDPDRRRLSPDHAFKTRAEMVAIFKDLPEAAANTVEIAMRCSYRPRTGKPILPRFTTGDHEDPALVVAEEAAELRRQAHEGLARRIANHGISPDLTEEDYYKRLDFELSVIERMKYPGYFLIVADFIKWAKSQDIPVGPGRGSGAGSLVAYATTITDLDPLRFGLLFERFLNPERVSMPDFDVDFCQDRREEVIRYVQGRYGHDRVAQIITFGSLLARGVMRDVGRVMSMSYGQVDKLTKLVPQNPANPVTLAQAIEGEPKLQQAAEEDPVVGRMLTVAQKLEGLYRHASTHAAGIVIGDRPLEQIVPLYRDPKSDMPVTQFNMKWVEPAGLVKFDFLGLKTLTTLKTAVNLIKQRGVVIDLSAIPIDDRTTYEMLGRGETVAVFQVESAGMRKALVEMRADRFEDIIALVALYRPGPMANIPVYCARKHGEEEPDFLHPKLEPVLKETQGVIIYQEQVMQIAQILSGYSLGEADLLRRAMGKKIKAEMEVQRVRFVDGAVERGLDRQQADTIFDLLAKFADYGFNKSHAAAYALVAYQTAYLKANYPVEFLAASMTLDMSNTDKLSEFRREAQRLGIVVEPPNINRSGVTFEVHPDGKGGYAIRYALAAVKGVGVQAVESLVAARNEGGPFKDLSDLARRLNPRMLNKRTLENLIAAGALDDLERDRARCVAALDAIMAEANRTQEQAAAGQADIFGSVGQLEPIRVPPYEPWLPSERLQREYDAIGFFLTGHPLDEYAHVLERLRVQRWADFARAVRGGASMGRVAATVLDRSERRTKSGSKMGIFALSDQSGHFEAIIFSEGLNQYRDLLEPGRAVVLTLQASAEGEEVRARIGTAEPLDVAAEKLKSAMRIFLRDEKPVRSIQERLRERGDGEISLVLMLEQGQREVEVKLPGRYKATPQIAGALKAVPGVVAVEFA